MEVAAADYQLIREDFPSTAHFSNEEIDKRIIERAGLYSKAKVTFGNRVPTFSKEYSKQFKLALKDFQKNCALDLLKTALGPMNSSL